MLYTNLSYLRESGHLCTHFKFDNLDSVRYDGRLIAFIEGSIEHLDGIVVKLVRKPRPVERE